MNDLQFLTGPSIADIDGKTGEEVLEGSSSADLAAYTTSGLPVSGWPKLSTDWTVATPLAGTFGTRDTRPGARKVVIGITRSGYLHAYRTGAPACSPSSSPRFHHDNANSGDYSRDAVLPGVPMNVTADGRGTAVRFRAPGDDLLCGRVDRFQLATSDAKIDASSFRGAKKLPRSSAPDPKRPGGLIRFDAPAGSKRFLAIRAVDEQGNVGRPVSVRVRPEPGGGGGRCGNRIRGTKRADRLRGSNEGDRIGGGRGDDRIKARGGDDCALGGKGDDRVAGDGGGDRINGGADDDRLKGGPGSSGPVALARSTPAGRPTLPCSSTARTAM
jgi:hypothetical protein